MRAIGADREQLVTPPDKQHRFIARVAEQHGPVMDRGEFHSLGEVGPAELGFMLTHLATRHFEGDGARSSAVGCLQWPEGASAWGERGIRLP